MTSDSTRSPREVFLALVHGVADRRGPDLAQLYADETDVVHPFDPERAPALRTRDQLREHFAAGAARSQRVRFAPEDIRIHDTTDPEVVVAEFTYRGARIDTGEPFEVPGIFVMRVRDGEIVESRDYFDHAAAAPR
jgi:ketosteroid isomerase-like protein